MISTKTQSGTITTEFDFFNSIQGQTMMLMGGRSIDQVSIESGVPKRQIKQLLKGNWMKVSHKSYKKLARYFGVQVTPCRIKLN